MPKIQLLAVTNSITRKHSKVQQELCFFMAVTDADYHKQIEVVWAGENGIWQHSPASYHSKAGQQEYWQLRLSLALTPTNNLAGNIKFSLRYRSHDQEYWDNNGGHNYRSEADSGVQLAQGINLLNIDFQPQLRTCQKYLPVTVAVAHNLAVEQVTIHWSTDNWRSSKQTRCGFRNLFWDKEARSNARNPNQYGVQIWRGWLRVGDAFGVQYSIAATTVNQVIWDNNHGHNYSVSHAPLKTMILNLHCYQEEQQDYKLAQIAKAITELEVDIVCLQEVAENWNDGQGDWESNAANIINQRLPQAYHLYTDWSHLGFDRYREGVAILSRYPILAEEARYVSTSNDPYYMHARKVICAQIDVPMIGMVNVFSAHLSWWEDGFQQQFDQLHAWADSKQQAPIKATLLCGDFNVTAGSQGYYYAVNTYAYNDQYLVAANPNVPEQNLRITDPYWQRHLASDYRIDYIFLHKDSQLRAKTARVLFTEHDYGTVSDHCGYLMVFEPK